MVWHFPAPHQQFRKHWSTKSRNQPAVLNVS